MSIRKDLKRILSSQTLVASGVLMLGLLLMNAWFIYQPRRAFPQSSFNALSHLSPEWVKWVSVGYWPAAVDGLWISTLSQSQYLDRTDEVLPRLREFYRLATDLDPNFFELYDQAGILFGFYFESAELAEEILKKGIAHYEAGKSYTRYWHRPFVLYMHLAYAQAFVAQNWLDAKQTYLRAVDAPGAPVFLKGMREWLEKEGSEKVLATRVLRLLIQNTKDETLRSKYQEKLKKYES